MEGLRPIEWIGEGRSGFVRLIDQTRLPNELVYLDCRDVEAVWGAIKRLSVRGAPAIGIAAGYGCVIGAQMGEFDKAAEYLAGSRPTAVNLFWAIERMRKRAAEAGVMANDATGSVAGGGSVDELLAEARAIHAEDEGMCRAIGEYGVGLIAEECGVITHCNAGRLATGGIGTATAAMYVAHERGVRFKVYADETRPLLQGARLTAWELSEAGIDVTVMCDGMAADVMKRGMAGVVIVGADRIAANGDVANKIGTYGLAVCAKYHGVPFYVAAPSSTFDMRLASGDEIPIEERGAEEVAKGFGARTVVEGVKIYNMAFDVTPGELITGIVTERGILEPVDVVTVGAMMKR